MSCWTGKTGLQKGGVLRTLTDCVIVGAPVLEPRFENLLAELERMVTDFRVLRREVREDPDHHLVQRLYRQSQALEAENAVLRQRQGQICDRLADLLGQVEEWEKREDLP